MKVVHIGTADNRGGAARAAFQLHQGLLAAGHASFMVVNQRSEDRPEIARIGFPATLAGRLMNRALLETERLTGLQNLLQPRRRAYLEHPFVADADVVHLHNLHGNFFPLTILPRLSESAPLVWTLHDTWALTGHCAYPYDCDRWRRGCGSCPRLGEYPPIAVDTTRLLWQVKRRAYARSRPTVVAPSRWLADMARSSPLLHGMHVHWIPYGIDTRVFRPADRIAARRDLGVPLDADVVMAVTLPGGERKGVELLEQALAREDVPALTVLAVGGGPMHTARRDITVRHVGFVATAEDMSRLYGAADVFVLPTRADNLPLTMLESLACATPVVGFAVGGVPDAVRTAVTGYLAREADVGDLARGIRTLIGGECDRAAMRQKCREVAVAEFSSERQAAAYIGVYHAACDAGPQGSVA